MFNVDGTTITLSKGDTGAVRIRAVAKRKDTGADYTFGERDRAVFSIKNGSGTVVKEKYSEMDDNVFTVVFYNHDTDKLTSGQYSWDVRYVINPYYDENGRIVDGDQVITPNLPMNVALLTVVGDI